MSETKAKEAKLQVKFEDIKFQEENKVKAILACIPIVGLILLFVEKEDQFVRFYGGLSTVFSIIFFILSIVLGVVTAGCLTLFMPFIQGIIIVISMVKANNGEKWEIPTITEYAVKIMNAV